MAIVKLNQKIRRVEISGFEIENDITFSYFDSIPAADRDDKLLRAIYIGVLALKEDRLSAFLSKTENELGTQLESLKMIFDMKQEVFFKSAIKGVLAEDDVVEFLNAFFESKKVGDKAKLTGNTAGQMAKNKTGDILCQIDGNDNVRIAIECKFDKSIRMGDIGKKDIFTNKIDTVWSQLIETQANRDSNVSIIVLDRSLIDISVLNEVDNIAFIPAVGFVVIIDSQKNDYSNLGIAYFLARDIAIKAPIKEIDTDILSLILRRIIKDINDIGEIRKLVMSNISSNKKILDQISKGQLSMEFNREYLLRFLSDGTLTKEDLFDFYMGSDVKEKFKALPEDFFYN